MRGRGISRTFSVTLKEFDQLRHQREVEVKGVKRRKLHVEVRGAYFFRVPRLIVTVLSGPPLD